jgi:hypothetical protein
MANSDDHGHNADADEEDERRGHDLHNIPPCPQPAVASAC